MKIAFLGSRGIPARYSGFETFYEQLATRLVERGHEITVYNRSLFIKDVRGYYRGVRIISLPSIPTKHLDTISHTFLSSFHALVERYDITYYCIVGNSPLVWIPRLTGSRVLLNVDGEDWARKKWSGFARWYQKKCEWIATKATQVIIADARIIQERYRKLYSTESIFVPYGGNIQTYNGTDTLRKWGLDAREYIFYVGRLVPENAVDLLIQAFKQVNTDKKLVIVGDAPFVDTYRKHLYALSDSRVVFTGYAFGQEYAQLSSHAYLYVQPSGINGTRPALLDQMGFGNCVLVRNSLVNMEVIRDCGCWFDDKQDLEDLKNKIQWLIDDPRIVEAYRKRATERIKTYYNWEWITDFYEELFQRMVLKKSFISYDTYLKQRKKENMFGGIA